MSSVAEDRQIIKCPKCGRQLATVKMPAENPLASNIMDLIDVACPVCEKAEDAELEAKEDLPGEGKPRKIAMVHCAACKRYLCTIKIFKDFKTETSGEFMHVSHIKCRKCNYENKFTLMVNQAQTQEAKP